MPANGRFHFTFRNQGNMVPNPAKEWSLRLTNVKHPKAIFFIIYTAPIDWQGVLYLVVHVVLLGRVTLVPLKIKRQKLHFPQGYVFICIYSSLGPHGHQGVPKRL